MGRYVKINGELVPIADIESSQNTNFVGTLADWEALTQEQKNAYDSVDLIDDFSDVTEEIENLTSQVTKTYTTDGITQTISATGNKFAEFVFDISDLGANEIIDIIPISDQAAWTTVNVRRVSNTSVTIQSHNLNTIDLSTTIYLIVAYR